MALQLPSQHRALVLKSVGADFSIEHLPTPQPSPGSAVVRILSAEVLSYHKEIYDGTRSLSFPTPLVGGKSAIGRVITAGPDATILRPGQLVFVDCVIRARDDPSVIFLSAIHEGGHPGSKKLMRDVWRDGNFAEYANVPLENCFPLDETKLCTTLGYSYHDLMYLSYLLVAFGGLRDIHVQPGDTVAIFPATGGFGGAGVQVAVSMGAKVIALGRNVDELARINAYIRERNTGASIETVKMTGDEAVDRDALLAHGPIDAVLDMTPPAAAKSTHLKSLMSALRYGARISLMGFVDFKVSEWKVIAENITLKGKLMYTREDIVQFIKMLELGKLPTGKELVDVKVFGLEDWQKAFDVAGKHTGLGRLVTFSP